MRIKSKSRLGHSVTVNGHVNRRRVYAYEAAGTADQLAGSTIPESKQTSDRRTGGHQNDLATIFYC